MNDGEGWEALFYSRVQARSGCFIGDSGRAQTEIAGELGIMPTMLRRWQRGIGVGAVKTAAQPPTSIMASLADQASEIAKLRRELDRTRMERVILKKAVGIFAEMPRRGSPLSSSMPRPIRCATFAQKVLGCTAYQPADIMAGAVAHRVRARWRTSCC